MDKKYPLALAAAVTAALNTSESEAATYNAQLVVFYDRTKGGYTPENISSSTATWQYDDVAQLLTQTGGTFQVRFSITPGVTTLFRHIITGLVIGNNVAASAATYSCIEGNFGGSVGASLCGNYNFGANFTNESSMTWGPGAISARTLGGDDMAIGPPQGVALYDDFATVSWVGTTLTLSNAWCNPNAPGNASGCASMGGVNTGYTWILSADPQAPVPIPAAAWLFGGAFGVLGWVRRRQSQG